MSLQLYLITYIGWQDNSQVIFYIDFGLSLVRPHLKMVRYFRRNNHVRPAFFQCSGAEMFFYPGLFGFFCNIPDP
jgi:hypothetical protein